MKRLYWVVFKTPSGVVCHSDKFDRKGRAVHVAEYLLAHGSAVTAWIHSNCAFDQEVRL